LLVSLSLVTPTRVMLSFPVALLAGLTKPCYTYQIHAQFLLAGLTKPCYTYQSRAQFLFAGLTKPCYTFRSHAQFLCSLISWSH
jgi:hypothetical protein